MNKEVIYLEPEDDITDILTKLQQAEKKLVALVPPKKGTMLRSAVNMKLVARVAKECEKIAVIVTVDPAIVKMAMAARIPVAKSLQSRPVIPTDEKVKMAEAEIQVIDEETGEMTTEKAPKKIAEAEKVAEDFLEGEEAEDDASDDKATEHAGRPTGRSARAEKEGRGSRVIELEEKAEDDPKAKKKNDKKKAKTSGGKLGGFGKVKKYLIIGVPAALIIIVALVWAFVFAPAATITVAVGSTTTNFAETVRFTTDAAAAKLEESILPVAEQKLEQKYTAKFTATGEEDKGDRASGEVAVSVSFSPREEAGGLTATIAAGDVLSTTDGQRYVAIDSVTLTYGGEDLPAGCSMSRCTLSGTVKIEAEKPGAEYNILSSASWNPAGVFSVRSSGAITGGSSKMVKVASQEDVDKAVEKLINDHKTEGKKYLYEDVGGEKIAIDASFKAEAKETTAEPKVSEEIGENVEPSVTVTVAYSVLVVEKAKIEEFIKIKQAISEGQRLYSIGEPYFERFTSPEEPAKMKTVIETGPIVTEDEVFERAKGHKTGEVASRVKAIDAGIDSVEVRTPYFWVFSVPEAREKVTIKIQTKGEE